MHTGIKNSIRRLTIYRQQPYRCVQDAAALLAVQCVKAFHLPIFSFAVSDISPTRVNRTRLFVNNPAEEWRLSNQNFAALRLKWLSNLHSSAVFDPQV